MSEKRCIVELEDGVWLAPWKGDPGRTLVKESAQKYMSRSSAKRGLIEARKRRPFKNAKIELVTFTETE